MRRRITPTNSVTTVCHASRIRSGCQLTLYSQPLAQTGRAKVDSAQPNSARNAVVSTPGNQINKPADGPHFRGFFHLPVSVQGRWSLRLWSASIAFFIAFFIFVSAGHRGGETFFSGSLWLFGTIMTAFAIGITGGVIASWAAVMRKDRSVLVMIPLAWGLLMLLWTIAEFAAPH